MYKKSSNPVKNLDKILKYRINTINLTFNSKELEREYVHFFYGRWCFPRGMLGFFVLSLVLILFNITQPGGYIWIVRIFEILVVWIALCVVSTPCTIRNIPLVEFFIAVVSIIGPNVTCFSDAMIEGMNYPFSPIKIGSIIFDLGIAIVVRPRVYLYLPICIFNAIIQSLIFCLYEFLFREIKDYRLLVTVLSILLNEFVVYMFVYVMNFSVRRAFLTMKQMERAQRILVIENRKTELLLNNILPELFISSIKKGKLSKAKFLTKTIREGCILQCDLINFTAWSSTLQSEVVTSILNKCFSFFDTLCEEFELQKLKTVGDSFIGFSEKNFNMMVLFGIGIIESLKLVNESYNERCFSKHINSEEAVANRKIRVGIVGGKFIVNVMGNIGSKLNVDLFGDLTKKVERYEETAKTNSVHVDRYIKERTDLNFKYEIGYHLNEEFLTKLDDSKKHEFIKYKNEVEADDLEGMMKIFDSTLKDGLSKRERNIEEECEGEGSTDDEISPFDFMKPRIVITNADSHSDNDNDSDIGSLSASLESGEDLRIPESSMNISDFYKKSHNTLFFESSSLDNSSSFFSGIPSSFSNVSSGEIRKIEANQIREKGYDFDSYMLEDSTRDVTNDELKMLLEDKLNLCCELFLDENESSSDAEDEFNLFHEKEQDRSPNSISENNNDSSYYSNNNNNNKELMNSQNRSDLRSKFPSELKNLRKKGIVYTTDENHDTYILNSRTNKSRRKVKYGWKDDEMNQLSKLYHTSTSQSKNSKKKKKYSFLSKNLKKEKYSTTLFKKILKKFSISNCFGNFRRTFCCSDGGMCLCCCCFLNPFIEVMCNLENFLETRRINRWLQLPLLIMNILLLLYFGSSGRSSYFREFNFFILNCYFNIFLISVSFVTLFVCNCMFEYYLLSIRIQKKLKVISRRSCLKEIIEFSFFLIHFFVSILIIISSRVHLGLLISQKSVDIGYEIHCYYAINLICFLVWENAIPSMVKRFVLFFVDIPLFTIYVLVVRLGASESFLEVISPELEYFFVGIVCFVLSEPSKEYNLKKSFESELRYKRQVKNLEIEQKKNENLILSVLPKQIVKRIYRRGFQSFSTTMKHTFVVFMKIENFASSVIYETKRRRRASRSYHSRKKKRKFIRDRKKYGINKNNKNSFATRIRRRRKKEKKLKYSEFDEEYKVTQLLNFLTPLFSKFDEYVDSNPASINIKKIQSVFLFISVISDEAVQRDMDNIGFEFVRTLKVIHKCAKEFQRVVDNFNEIAESDEDKVGFLAGICYGKIGSGVLGTKKFIFDIFGDTVNLAARLCYHSSNGRINVSNANINQFVHPIKSQVEFIPRGLIWLKGKGHIKCSHIKLKKEYQ